MKKVVSISLGSSTRNKSAQVDLFGETFQIERIGTDGDKRKFAQMFVDLDGKVDAIGVGGCDIYVVAGNKKYAFREIKTLVSGAVKTPVVDGSGLKHTLERETILSLQNDGILDFKNERVLLMSAVDRYGMADSLAQVCPNVLYGDLMFGLGVPIRIRSYATLLRLGRIILPIITKLPFQWFYPTGEKQEQRTPKFTKDFDWASVIAGDSLYILRYAPDKMPGKTLITQSIRKQNLEFLKAADVKQVITTTPVIEGETFATNVMEAVLCSILGKRPEAIQPEEYVAKLKQLDWKPNVLEL